MVGGGEWGESQKSTMVLVPEIAEDLSYVCTAQRKS